MTVTDDKLEALRSVADPDAAAAIAGLLRDGSGRELNRVNALEFSESRGLRVDRVIGAFVHASRLGLFEMSWNLLCPGCGGVLDANESLKTMRQQEYPCALCAAGYEPSLDEMVEVSFTVHPRVRAIPAHDPDALPLGEYQRQIFWSSGIRLPEGERFDALMAKMVVDSAELAPGSQCVRDLVLPDVFTIIFDPVSHTAQFIDVKGAPTSETRELKVFLRDKAEHPPTITLAPGPLRLTLANGTRRRALPAVYRAGDDLHEMLGNRKPFLTAKQLLSSQVFRDLYGERALDVDQRLKITSLTFLFTDLKGSTALYDRVGDLQAFDLVKSHFRRLQDVVSSECGAVVKTIGDAVMATFPTPERGLAAALRMGEALCGIGEGLAVKIGLHEGPCLAVMLDERLDYFGQTVNIAARVQALAHERSIYATEPVIRFPGSAALIERRKLALTCERRPLKGVSDAYPVFEIPVGS